MKRVSYSIVGGVLLVGVASVGIAGQTPIRARGPAGATAAAAAVKGPAQLRTPWGEPDLQGTWTYKTITPLERPAEFAGKEFLTDADVAQVEKRAAGNNTDDRPKDAARDVATAYNDFWWDRGDKVVKSHRSSLIIDPPDGRIPPVTADGRARLAARAAAMARDAWGPEDRSQFERCVSRGIPRMPGGYNQNLQIFQTPGYVVILYEMMREARIVPVDGRPHVSKDVRQWLGDSRGRWDDDTLVVETTNFNRQHEFRGASEHLRLIERFKRADAGTIDYQFTAEDPSTWTEPWTAAIPLNRTNDQIYEYACHEGNYGMPNLLRSARAVDKRKDSN